ncbi:MAG: hypothetical protein CTY15_13265 [Methylocystis sp.]|nr:MAG: hypothetical protein CTY15_13265 [Methylocystis sp.]
MMTAAHAATGEFTAMTRHRRPTGRESALAQAALETLKQEETRENEIAATAPLRIAPVAAIWRSAGRGAIRLIDLERRARFARLAFES